LMALRSCASCVYVGSPWMVGREVLGKLSIIASGDGSVDAMLDWEGWACSCVGNHRRVVL
jgi:hypothetical protein